MIQKVEMPPGYEWLSAPVYRVVKVHPRSAAHRDGKRWSIWAVWAHVWYQVGYAGSESAAKRLVMEVLR